MRKILFLFTCLFITIGLKAQSTEHCGSDFINELHYQQDRGALWRMQQFDDLRSSGQLTPPGSNSLYTIPVVVHIIHNGGPENIPNSQVLDAIQHLNDAFANVGVFNPNTGVNVEIEFCLAVRDPNGVATSGINRVQSPLTNLTVENDDISLKNLIRWDPTQYLNIWVVNEINTLAMGPSVAGYAYFPSSHGQPEDGIVNEAQFFGTSTDGSKVHIHEAGHYLGLYHTFQGGCANGNCLAGGDKVCDTPPDATTSPIPCASTINSCTTDDDDLSVNNPFRPVSMGGLGDQNDMFINYMDYGINQCQTAFTDGQKYRMIDALTGPRSSLLSSQGCQTVCASPVTAAFIPGATFVYTGTPITFTNQSGGATQFDWKINGQVFSNVTSPTYNFNNTGLFTITLVASNPGPGCIDSLSVLIEVICTAQASFTASANQVNTGGTVNFTNTSTGASSQTWLLDNVQVATSFNYSHQFNTPGGYHLQLIASDATCSDTSTIAFVKVGSCSNKRDNIWYFGDSVGLDFSNGAPVALSNGNMTASEGSSTISDNAGNLLFYTNSLSVYDRNHNVMPNGAGLLGHTSSTMSSLIIPRPGYPDQYYIFTTAAAETQGANGIRYSIVDMSMNSGLGDVTQTKNISLLAPCNEKLTAHYQADRQNIWVMTQARNTNEYHAYSVTSIGVSSTPVISTPPGSIASGIVGALRFSHNGKKLANLISVGPQRGIELCDFDPLTGVVSNPFFIPMQSSNIQLYSVDFSASDLMLYTSNWNGGGLYQVNLGAGSPTAIINSLVQISNTLVSEIRLGPDDKIYCSNGYFYMATGVVNDPEVAGTGCNFVATQVSVPGQCNHGLNNLFCGYDLPPGLAIQGPVVVCTGSGNAEWSVSGVNPGDVVDWELLGNGNVVSETDTSFTVTPGSTGNGTVILTVNTSCGFLSDTLDFQVVPGISIDLGNDTAYCPAGSLNLNPGSGFASYFWQDGSTAQTHAVTGPGIYSVQVTDSGGCKAEDSIVVAPFLAAGSLNLGPDAEICPDGVRSLDAGPGFLSYQWQDGSPSQSYTAWLPGTYSVTVTDGCGATATDQIVLSLANVPPLDLGPDTLWCDLTPFALNAGSGFTSYYWQNGSTAPTFMVGGPGLYWVEVTTSNGCLLRDDILISPCVGLDEHLAEGSFVLFPNPGNGEFTLRFGAGALSKGLRMRAWDAQGRMVQERDCLPGGAARDVKLDLQGQPAGIYLLMLEAGAERVTVKVEIAR